MAQFRYRDHLQLGSSGLIGSIIGALLLNVVYEKVGFWLLLAGVTLMLILFALSLVAAFLYLNSSADALVRNNSETSDILQTQLEDLTSSLSTSYKEISNKLNRLGAEADAATDMPWLLSRTRVMEIERETDADQIWVISRFLEEEVGQGTFGDVVSDNLRRGILYHYFIPNDDPSAEAQVASIISHYGNDGGIAFHRVEHYLFDLVAAQDVLIIDPFRNPVGYMNLPIDSGGNDFFLLMGSSVTKRIIGRLKRNTLLIENTTATRSDTLQCSQTQKVQQILQIPQRPPSSSQ